MYVEVVGTDNNNYYKMTTDGINFSAWIQGTGDAETTPLVDFNDYNYNFTRGDSSASQPALCVEQSPISAAEIISVEFDKFEQADRVLDNNPGNGKPNSDVGLRIFPDKVSPGETSPNRAKVKINASVPNALPTDIIYFRTYDMDDPSDDAAPIDTNASSGGDNRGNANTPLSAGKLTKTSAKVINGVATVELEVTKQPGDNFAVVASKSSLFLYGTTVTGQAINKGAQTIPVSGQGTPPTTPTNPAMRTQLLTVWRKLHIEIDDMGVVQNNPPVTGALTQPLTVDNGTSIYQVGLPTNLEIDRYLGGKIYFSNGSIFKVNCNGPNGCGFNIPGDISLTNDGTLVTLPVGTTYEMWDDDDFNNNDGTTSRPLHGDNGEDIFGDSEILSAIQEADNSPNQTPKNVYAAAYIKPAYGWTSQFNTSNVSFTLNVDYNQTGYCYSLLEN